MNVQEAYLHFLNQVNRNRTNNNIDVDKSRFVYLYNDIRNRWIEWTLEKRNEDQIRYVSPLLIPNKKLVKHSSEETYDSFNLPSDYFDLANLHIHAKTPVCSGVEVTPREIKVEDVEEKYQDDSYEPDLAYRQTFYHTADNRVLVYKKNFEIQEAFLSYYRYPRPIDIEGYFKIDGSPSQNVDPELDDKVVNRIIVAMAKEYSAINEDSQGYQLDNDRLFKQI